MPDSQVIDLPDDDDGRTVAGDGDQTIMGSSPDVPGGQTDGVDNVVDSGVDSGVDSDVVAAANVRPTESSPDALKPRDGEGLDAFEADELSGRTLGDFRVLRTLGQGGMAKVYLAEQVALRRQVALKVMQPAMLAKPGAVERFRREAMAAANLSHGNIVQVYTVGEVDGQWYIAMEYVAGRNLRQWVRRSGPLALGPALKVMRQAAAALDAAGAAGIVHRDIKPANLLISRRGVIKIADFGLSLAPNSDPSGELTEVGQTVGTPRYMSPEQVEGRPTDHRSDLYSLGVTFYYLLAGQAPYDGGTPVQIALQHLKGTPPPLGEARPDLPPELCRLVHQMMARTAADRPASAAEVADRLRAISREHLTNDDETLAVSSVSAVSAMSAAAATGRESISLSLRRPLVRLLGSSAASVRSPKVLVLPLLGLFAVGVLAGVAMRPVDPLSGRINPHPRAATAEQQLVEAMFDGRPESFAAVERYWPGSLYAEIAAKQRLLMWVKDPRRAGAALDLIDELNRRPDAAKFAGVIQAARIILKADRQEPGAESALAALSAEDRSRLPDGWQAAIAGVERRLQPRGPRR